MLNGYIKHNEQAIKRVIQNKESGEHPVIILNYRKGNTDHLQLPPPFFMKCNTTERIFERKQ